MDEKGLPGDPLLKTILATANKENITLGITLNVEGMIISGILISSKEYYEGLAQQLKEPSDRKETNNLTKTLVNIINQYIAQEGQALTQDYIHLKDARFHYASQDIAPIDQGVWWRGKLSSVDGFTLGTSLLL